MKRLLILSALFAIHCAAAQPTGDYELKGFFGSGKSMDVSVRKNGSTQSVWLTLGRKQNGMLVEKADSRTGTATLNIDGVRYELRLAAEAPPTPTKTHWELLAEIEKASVLGSRLEKIRGSHEHNKPWNAVRELYDKKFLIDHPEFKGPNGLDLHKVNETRNPDLGRVYSAGLNAALSESGNPVLMEYERLSKIQREAYRIALEKNDYDAIHGSSPGESAIIAGSQRELEFTRYVSEKADQMLAAEEKLNGPIPPLKLTPLMEPPPAGN